MKTMTAKEFYTKKSAKLKNIAFLLESIKGLISDISDLEEAAPGGDVGELYELNTLVDSAHSEAHSMIEAVEYLVPYAA